MRSVERGFTAIEMMVTVAIIAVLLSVVVPSFQEQLARRKLEGAATELNTDIQFMRTQSVDNNDASNPVVLATSANGYTVTRTVGGVTTTYKTVALDPSLSLTAGVNISYEPLRGLANAVTLDLMSSRTAALMRVETNAMGRVTLCSPGGSLKGYTTC